MPSLATRFIHQIVVPLWIVTVGLVTLSGAVLDVSMSLAVFVVGVIIVPALLVMPGGPVPFDEVAV